ncbi:MAG: response regulator [Verrucomicrobiota bacterium]
MNISRLIILLAEDDPNDVLLLQRAFKKNGIELPVHVSADGEDAMLYLKGEGKYKDRETYPFPRVIITDLKMPKCSGFDLLRWLHEHPECSLIPKIVLSASAEEQDVALAYQLGVNCYFQKPREFSPLCKIVELANTFWNVAEIPPLPENC